MTSSPTHGNDELRTRNDDPGSSSFILHPSSLSSHLRALLTEPDAPARPGDFGPWNPFVDELAALPDLGSRRAAFDTNARVYPQLRQLTNGAAPAALPLAPAIVTATDVLRMEFPPRRFIIPNLLPEGLTLLAGRPKQGKSWITLQLARAVATGGQVFGETVPQGRGLICALEDGYERLQDRMRAQAWPDPCDAVQYVISLDELGGPLDKDGLAGLERRIIDHHLSYVVIDTFVRAVGLSDVNDMAETTAALKGLQLLALRHRVAVVCVHHTTKLASDDFLDAVAGSTGLTAVADGIAVLKRRRFEDTAALHIVHRDLGKERSLALQWDDASATWHYAGDAGTVQRADDQRDVLLAMLSLAKLGEAATPQKIADVVDRNRGNVYKDLAGLVELGLVIRATRRGAYSLTEQGHRDATDLAEQRSPATGNEETGKQQKPENGETPAVSPSPTGRGPG